ncbi:hypothetical protein H310_11656 [Aphanomyces invadans]|uniref:BK channel n=1 Tax=Aphanomyces invadans TaxID=157072 RepID=A0A024TKJ2_9STRA|nr:hypothetical protein H310_11656 [Aphanomyces invadans]ETV94670.1 hypothetical protein H310_11656 [Aphanomyces invadans]|eukprot:XP_008876615.1 hypothetical protein H310_11656 [Aphanomyces invadans]
MAVPARVRGMCRHVGAVVKTNLKKLVKARMRGETFRKWIGRNIDNSVLASSIDIFQVMLGLLVTVVYFTQNWQEFSPNLESSELLMLQWVIGVFFSLDYVMRMYAADSRRMFFLSPLALVDFVTILPQWLEVLFEANEEFRSKASAMKTLRALRFLRAYRLLVFSKSAKGRQGGVLFLTVMSIIICSAGVIQAVESCSPGDIEGKTCQTLEIYNACYFVVITIATLGYGDIAPKSRNGKVCVIFLIFSTGILLPLQISRYSDILSRETEYDKSFTAKKEKNPHILICGEVNSSPLDFFLRQFLHPNNMNWKDKVVILCPGLPSHNLKRILLNSAYEQRVVYLQGSAMLDSDLKRAGAANARLCFVMLNKLSADGDRSDTASNLLTISLRHHTKRVPLFVQVLKTDNIRHVHLSGASNIVCVDQLKMGMLAKSCVIPGLCALVCNILFTFRPFYKKSTLWTSEFLHGCAHDIYEARIPSFLHDLINVSTLTFIMYCEYDILLLGVTDNLDEFRLFPSKLRLKKSHTIIILSKTPDCSRWLEGLTLTTLLKYQHMIPDFVAIADAWLGGSLSARLRTTGENMRKSMSLSRSHTMRTLKSALTIKGESGNQRTDRSVNSQVHPCNPPDGDGGNVDDDDDDDDDEIVAAYNPSLSGDHQDLAIVVSVPATDPPIGIPVSSTPQSDTNHATESHMSGVTTHAMPKQLAPLQIQRPHINLDPISPSAGIRSPEGSILPQSTPCAPPCATDASAPKNARKSTMTYLAFANLHVPPDLSNHIILCGMPNMLHDFVAPLRPNFHRTNHSTNSVTEVDELGKETVPVVPIVVISQVPMTEKQYASISMFHQVYYVNGSPLHESVLREACVFNSKSIVIISACIQGDNEIDQRSLPSDFIDQNLIDTDAITLHRFITEACESNCPMDAPLPTVIIELSRPSSLRFLKDDHNKSAQDAEMAVHVKAMTKQVLSRADDPLDNICHPLYAAGKVCVANFLDALLGSCNSYGTMVDLFHLLILGEPAFESTSNTRVIDQIPVPRESWGTAYGQLVQNMLMHQDALVIGLYRSRGGGLYFVFLNPSEDVVVTPQDKLFIIR